MNQPIYTQETFVRVAADCPAEVGTIPPTRKTPSIAALHYKLLSEAPYSLTIEALIVEVARLRKGLGEDARDALHTQIFAKPQPCMRASPLTRRYGWGVHVDAQGRLALLGQESEEYTSMAAREDIHQTAALRSKRA